MARGTGGEAGFWGPRSLEEGSCGAGAQTSGKGALPSCCWHPKGTKRLVLGVQVPWSLDVNVSIAGVLMLRGPGRPQEAAGPFPASAARDPGAPCWQRLEGSSTPDKRGAGVPQLTWSPLPRPSLRAASGQWLGVVGGTRKARGLETGPSASVATGGREQDRSAQWTSALGKR